MGNTYNWVYNWCCKYGENRYCERCANKKWCASKHTGLLNSCLEKLCLHPYLVVPLISARVALISTRVSAHCQAILFPSQRASNVELWYFLCCKPYQCVKQTVELPVVCDTMKAMWSLSIMLWTSASIWLGHEQGTAVHLGDSQTLQKWMPTEQANFRADRLTHWIISSAWLPGPPFTNMV